MSRAQQEHQTSQSLRYAWSQLHTPQEGGNVPANVLLTVFLGVRALAERVLQDSSEQLRVQCSRVEQAFSRRCVELTEAKLQLEMKLTQVDPVKDQQVFMAAAGFSWF